MKKLFFTITAILFTSFALFSCSSDDNEDNPNPPGGGEDPKELLEFPYSSLSVEDQKKKLEVEGKASIKLMEGLPNEKSLQLLESFNEIGNGLIDLLEGKEDDIAPTPMPTNRASDPIKDIIKLSQYYGEYAWDSNKKVWKKTDTKVTDKLIAIFPAIKGGSADGGKIEVKAVSSTTVIDGREIPAEVIADLYVSGAKEGEIKATATGINESTYAETADVNAKLGAYNFITDIDKKGAKNESKFTFSKGSDLILDANVDLEANITAQMIDKEDIASIKDVNVVMNIAKNLAVAGYVDGKSLATELKRIREEQRKMYSDLAEAGWDDVDWVEIEEKKLGFSKATIAAFNAHTNIALVSTSEEYKVAKVTFDLNVEKHTATYSRYKRDKDGNIIEDELGYPKYEDYEYTYYSVKDIYILHFSDETKVDAAVFFGSGFETVANMWKDFVAKFN